MISLHIAHSPNARDCMGTKFYNKIKIRVYVKYEIQQLMKMKIKIKL